MFDLVHKHKRIAQLILAMISIPFALFGVDYYFRQSDAAGDVAKFDGGQITVADFGRAIRDQQDNMRRSGQQNVDPAIFDNPEVRYNLLQQLLRERMVEKKATDLHFVVTNEQLADRIASDPRFRSGDKFSLDLYKSMLAQAGVPEQLFEDSIRRQLLTENLLLAFAGGLAGLVVTHWAIKVRLVRGMLSDEAFLRHRRHQAAIAAEQASAGKPARP